MVGKSAALTRQLDKYEKDEAAAIFVEHKFQIA